MIVLHPQDVANIALFLGVAICIVVLVQCIWRWIKELSFYNKNGWAFNQCSREWKPEKGKANDLAHIESANRGRVLYWYPLCIAVFAFSLWGLLAKVTL